LRSDHKEREAAERSLGREKENCLQLLEIIIEEKKIRDEILN